EPLLFVTETFKQKIEKANFKGISFQQAVKHWIVLLEWEKWDLTADEPALYPSGDMDAEEYIVRRKHNEKLAAEMETIWAVVLPKKGFVTKETTIEKPALVEQTIGYYDIFSAEYKSHEIFVSEKAVLWFKENIDDELYFEKFPVTKISKEELDKTQNDYNQSLIKRERESKMTKKDWQLWHRLLDEAKKLLTNLETAKREETKIKWKQKALENIRIANEMYPLNEREMDTLQKIMDK
ncbi:MAG: hypothetical protein LBU73_00175, partial [Helicobacteraceae bacterium]|nr:hypothetical protein [Helicobacteraceae bacterium]